MDEYARIAIAIFIITEPFVLLAFLEQRAALEIGRKLNFEIRSAVFSNKWKITTQILRLICWCAIVCMSFFGKWYYGVIAITASVILSTILPVPEVFYCNIMKKLEKIEEPSSVGEPSGKY